MVRSSSTPRGCTLAKERGPGTEGNHRKRYECAFDFIRHRGPRHSGPLVVRSPRCAPARSDEVPPQRRPVSAAVCGDSEEPYPHLALRPTYTHTHLRNESVLYQAEQQCEGKIQSFQCLRLIVLKSSTGNVWCIKAKREKRHDIRPCVCGVTYWEQTTTYMFKNNE